MNTYKKKIKLMKYTKATAVSYTLTVAQSAMLSLYAELFLDEVCYQFNKDRLKASIDQSIDQNNYNEFMELSRTYKELIKVKQLY